LNLSRLSALKRRLKCSRCGAKGAENDDAVAATAAQLRLLWVNHLWVVYLQTQISFSLAESLRIGERN